MNWHELIGAEKEQPYFLQAMNYVQQARSQGVVVYPPVGEVFNAFRYTSADNVKVVILGQDPYHGPQQAHGLCFSVNSGIPQPPSLKNIFKELQNEYPDFQIPQDGTLTGWAEQGVLLLNNSLTVEQGNPGSHAHIGWEIFTDHVIQVINERLEHVVFMLWGSPAQTKCRCVDSQRHLILKASHPSPLSAYRTFFGCNHFKLCNEYLQQHGKTPIDWQRTV